MLLSGNLHVFLPPQSFNPLIIHSPAIGNQLSIGALTAKARLLAGDPTHLSEQPLFVGTTAWVVSLRVAVLTQHTADSTLRHLPWPQATTHLSSRAPPSLGA